MNLIPDLSFYKCRFFQQMDTNAQVYVSGHRQTPDLLIKAWFIFLTDAYLSVISDSLTLI